MLIRALERAFDNHYDAILLTLRPSSMATNRIITIAIITVLVLLIMAVVYSKFR